jgi:hypothetical protein
MSSLDIDMPGYGTKSLPDGYDDDDGKPEPEDCRGCRGGSARNGKHCKRDGNCPPEEDE